MVRVREPKSRQPTDEEVEAFAAGADGGKPKPSKTAPRRFKSINLPLNEAEYIELEQLAEATGRSKASALRWAVKEALKQC